MTDVLQWILSNWWAALLAAFFFCASIFVHELGHFLAARWRKLKIERFSIGFGPRLFGWRGKDGVDYRFSLVPMGGYVALPQLADMRGIEGTPSEEAEALPPISYTDKMIVSAAGAVFNVIFALFLACILWGVGQYTNYSFETTTIGYVAPTVTLDGEEVQSGAAAAGLQVGDRITHIDGNRVHNWQDVTTRIITGNGRAADGRPQAIFTIEREGVIMDMTVNPTLSGREDNRQAGIQAWDKLVVASLYPESPAAVKGIPIGAEVLTINGEPVQTAYRFYQLIDEHSAKPVTLTYQFEDTVQALTLKPEIVEVTTDGQTQGRLGILFQQDTWLVHRNPIEQLQRFFSHTVTILYALLHPQSNISITDLSGPVGISYALAKVASYDIREVIALAALVNVSLALMNILPIPVLDGGHMAFATWTKLTGRRIPPNLMAGVQGAFMIMLLGLMLYILFPDTNRVVTDIQEEKEFTEQLARRIAPVFDGVDAIPQESTPQ